MEMLLISIANRRPEPGAGERLANEKKFPRDRFHLWVFFSGRAADTAREGSIFPFFLMTPKGNADPRGGSGCRGQRRARLMGGGNLSSMLRCSPGAGAAPAPRAGA